MTKKIEILSPAGSWASLKAAAAAGADAVYFGGSGFNARRKAENFTDDDIGQVVSFCHARGMKAYFTLNTVVFEGEMGDALALAAVVCDAGADALITADLGLCAQLRRAAPSMRLHASTQMSAHNLSGVRELESYGFSRVVLARELSGDEIAQIAAHTSVELEVFVHGAHCMSVSGQCYMSAFFGGTRSGNRGFCAQPCRLPFSVSGARGADTSVLSLKDLSLIMRLAELARLGIVSAKIEGRLKRPEYVAAATQACRKAADGESVSDEEQSALSAVFSREGFTSGYYDGERTRAMFGVRSHADVTSGAAVLRGFQNIYEGVERMRVPVDLSLFIRKGESVLRASDGGENSVEVAAQPPQQAVHRAIDREKASAQLSKTGSTPFFPHKIDVCIEPGLTVPVSQINAMRRDALLMLLAKRGEKRPVPFAFPAGSEKPEGFSTDRTLFVENLRLRFRSADQIPDGLDPQTTEMLVLPLSEILRGGAERLQADFRIGAQLPRTAFSDEDAVFEQLLRVKALGVADAVCPNLYAIHLARRAGLVIHADFGLNAANGAAVDALAQSGAKSCVFSFEAPIAAIREAAARADIPTGMILYGRLPLMLVRACPVKVFRGCREDGCAVIDRMHIEFPLVCENGVAEILNSRVLQLFSKKAQLMSLPTRFFEFCFTTETKRQAAHVLSCWAAGTEPEGDFTRGLYFAKSASPKGEPSGKAAFSALQAVKNQKKSVDKSQESVHESQNRKDPASRRRGKAADKSDGRVRRS